MAAIMPTGMSEKMNSYKLSDNTSPKNGPSSSGPAAATVEVLPSPAQIIHKHSRSHSPPIPLAEHSYQSLDDIGSKDVRGPPSSRLTKEKAEAKDDSSPCGFDNMDDLPVLIASQRISNGSAASVEEPKKIQINISPNSPVLQSWDLWIGMLLLFFVAMITPFEVAFIETKLGSPLFWTNRFVDLCFVVDMCLQPFVPVKDTKNNNKLIRENSTLLRMYMKSWFPVDLLSIVPFDILTDVFNLPPNLRIVRVARLMKLAKLLRVLKSMKILEKYESKITMSHTTQSLLKFLFLILILAHWGACVWYLTSTIGDANNNWVVGYGIRDASTFDKYSTAFYWATMTLMTIGYGDVGCQNTTERFISTILMLISGCVYAYIIGGICGIFASMNQEVSDFQMTLDSLNSLLFDNRTDLMGNANKEPMDPELKGELKAYFRDCEELHKVKYNNEVLAMMSPKLQKQFTVACYGHWLKAMPFIKPVGEEDVSLAFDFVAELVLKMTQVYFPAAEQVLYIGEEANCMYVIRKGLVGCKGSVLRRDKIFGEEMIAVATRYNIAMTLTFTTLMRLEQEDFALVLQNTRYTGIRLGVIRRARWMLLYYSLQALLESKKIVLTRFLDPHVRMRWETKNGVKTVLIVMIRDEVMGSIKRGHLNLLHLDSSLKKHLQVLGGLKTFGAKIKRLKTKRFRREVAVTKMTEIDLQTQISDVIQEELQLIEPKLGPSVELGLSNLVQKALNSLPRIV